MTIIRERLTKISPKKKMLSTFVNDADVDKIVRVRAATAGKDKSDIFREAIIEYFENHELSNVELELLTL